MAHHTKTTHRRSLDHPHPATAGGAGAATMLHHPQNPDPTTVPPSTIKNISTHFSKLYTNHKILTNLRKGGAFSHPSPDYTHSQDNSCTTLTKSKSQHGRRVATDAEAVKVKDKVVKVKVPFEAHDVDETAISEKKSNGVVKMVQEQPNAGRRKSFCSSKTELFDFFTISGVKVVAVDMPPFMQRHAVGFARKCYDSMEKFTARALASTLKKEFDGVYGPAWHCIVGTSFGSYVTHSVGGFIYFSMDNKLYVLLFKTTVQKAD